jgi:hypothetical protein
MNLTPPGCPFKATHQAAEAAQPQPKNDAAATLSPTDRAFLLQEELSDLREARRHGADVSPLEELELEDALQDALAAETEGAF